MPPAKSVLRRVKPKKKKNQKKKSYSGDLIKMRFHKLAGGQNKDEVWRGNSFASTHVHIVVALGTVTSNTHWASGEQVVLLMSHGGCSGTERITSWAVQENGPLVAKDME